MGYGVPSSAVRRLKNHQVSLPCQFLLPAERTCSGTTRLYEESGRRHELITGTHITVMEDSHRHDYQEVKQYAWLPALEAKIF